MTNAYLYRAALLCEACAHPIRAAYLETHPACGTGTWSDVTPCQDNYPHGPYPQGGGESDTPAHCDNCQVFLENPLTDDGIAYVRDAILMHARTNAGNPDVLAQWSAFYFDALQAAPRATSSYLNKRLRSESEALADLESAA